MSTEEEKTIGGLIIAIGTLVAISVPGVADFFAPYLFHALFFLVVFSLVPYAGHELSELRKLHPVVPRLVFWQQLMLPGVVLAIGQFMGVDSHTLFLMLVILASGSLFASPTLVQLMGLNHKIAMQSVIVSTFVAPISIFIPFWLFNDSNTVIEFDIFAQRIFIFLVVPILILFFLRAFVAKSGKNYAGSLEKIGRWGSIAALLIFCFAIEEKAALALSEEPGKILRYLGLAIFVSFISLLLTRIIMSKYNSDVALTVSILASFRNVGLTYGLVASSVDYDLSVFVGVCQIPMFFAPFLFDLMFGSGRSTSTSGDDSIPDRDKPISDGELPNEQFGSGFGLGGDAPGAGRAGALLSVGSHAIQHAMPAPEPAHGWAGAAVASASPAPGSATPVLMTDGSAALRWEPEPFDAEYASDSAEPEMAAEPLDANDRLRMRIERFVGLQIDLQKHLDDLQDELEDMGLLARRYVMGFLVLFIVGAGAVWQANKYFAPMLFDQQLIERVADAHIAGQNFAVFDLNINIRDLRDATIERMPEVPDVVVLGASHWQEAHTYLVRNKTFYNSHVHRDYYEDMLAMVEMYMRHGKMPKEMIITIRDNLLTPIRDRTDFLWLPGIKYYRKMADHLGLEAQSYWETLPVQTWRELVSLPLLWTHASRQLMAQEQPHASDLRHFEALDTLLPGGSILWSAEHQHLFSQERARREALAFAEAKRNNPPKIDPKGVEHIDALLTFLQEQGVKVTLAHPQFNPIFWDAVQGSPYMDGLRRVEEQTRLWAEKYGLDIIGGFAPEQVGCTADMYIDAEHGNPTCLGMLLDHYNLLNDPGALRGPVS